VRNDDVRWKTEQPHLSVNVQARRLSLFGHTARMPDESDTKHILTASPLENWRDHWDASILRGWRLPSRTWNHWCNWHGSESSTLENDVYVWCYALIVVHARNEWRNELNRFNMQLIPWVFWPAISNSRNICANNGNRTFCNCKL